MSDLTEDELKVALMKADHVHRRPRRFSIPIGSVFARLTVKQEIKRGRQTWYVCQCACGKETTVQMNNLRPGGAKSCGCAIGTHGMAKRGKNRTPTYSSWSHMITRCTNANFHAFARYGGRGITVHSAWMTFKNFLADMGEQPAPGLTIERKDNDGNYEPGNCYWGTHQEQMRNRSMTRWVVLNGETICFADAAVRLGVSAKTMQSWRRNGRSHQATVDHYATRARSQ